MIASVVKAEPVTYVREACVWVRNHPDKFKRLMHLCHREVDRGNPSIQRGDIYNLARRAGFDISECDEVDMAGMWREIVNPTTTFLARNWQEAKRAHEEGCVCAA